MAKKISWLILFLIIFFIVLNVFYTSQFLKASQNYLSLSENNDHYAEKIIKNYQKINQIIKKIIFKPYDQDLKLIFQHFLANDQHYLVLLQNSDELRATGGFMGSYLFLDFNAGNFSLGPIQDIYEIAGQQTNFPTSPPGQAEYLSEGKGLPLQDANWWPDTASSAEEILAIWQEIEKNSPYVNDEQTITGLIFLNLDFFEAILEFLGPISLHDYTENITADNFALLARANRLDFFAGSTEKADFLNQTKIAVLEKIKKLSWREKIELLKIIENNLKHKNLQIYSQDEAMEKIWQKQGLAGQLIRHQKDAFYFFSVESNVGINKANHLVERHFEFWQDDQGIKEIQINFSNNNQAPQIINSNPDLKMANHLSYINYQRFYFSPNVTIEAVQKLKEDQSWETLTWQTQTVFNHQGQEFLELATLFTIPEQSEAHYRILLNKPNKTLGLELQKQAGIKAIPITLHSSNTEKQSWTLSSDQLE